MAASNQPEGMGKEEPPALGTLSTEDPLTFFSGDMGYLFLPERNGSSLLPKRRETRKRRLQALCSQLWRTSFVSTHGLSGYLAVTAVDT